MKKVEVISKKSSKAVGPYSQAVKYGNLVFVTGQIGIDPKINKMVKGIKQQTNQTFENLKNVLEAAGSSLNNVLKVNVYLQNMSDYIVMNEIYASQFKKPYPARATIEAAHLPVDALVEIDCVAYVDDQECCGGGQCNRK